MNKTVIYFASTILLLIGISLLAYYGASFLQSPSPSPHSTVIHGSSAGAVTPQPSASAGAILAASPIPASSAAPPAGISFKMTAVGDILLGRGVGDTLRYNKLDHTYPFQKVKDLLGFGDVIFGNLEQSISSRGTPFTDKIVLRSPPESVQGLTYAGFTLMNLANNHMLDYGEDALADTTDILRKNGIRFTGAGPDIEQARKPAIIEVNSRKIGLLAYSEMAQYFFSRETGNRRFAAGKDLPGIAPLKKEWILEDLEKLRSEVDFIILSLHWGTEDSFEISPEQVKEAHEFLDRGADMIIGHHPHQVQGIEIYKGKPIAYSLGNFLFDQYEPENQESIILQMEYRNGCLFGLEAVPLKIVNMSQVVPQEGQEAERILLRQKELSEKLGAKCSLKSNRLLYFIEK